ncbi:hypothetical protein CGZ80_11860 [Rhodopirellula sp. MGV]|nr:hypothetical protein CGZ80_11860 [Rhodopirellula sp. MGV]PNY37753.1 hypothetical protein C2E31_06360 [Rhodopirellula baltica]
MSGKLTVCQLPPINGRVDPLEKLHASSRRTSPDCFLVDNGLMKSGHRRCRISSLGMFQGEHQHFGSLDAFVSTSHLLIRREAKPLRSDTVHPSASSRCVGLKLFSTCKTLNH